MLFVRLFLQNFQTQFLQAWSEFTQWRQSCRFLFALGQSKTNNLWRSCCVTNRNKLNIFQRGLHTSFALFPNEEVVQGEKISLCCPMRTGINCLSPSQLSSNQNKIHVQIIFIKHSRKVWQQSFKGDQYVKCKPQTKYN